MSGFGSSAAAPLRLTNPPATGSSRINVGPAERLISALAGSALIAAGMKRGSLVGLAAAGLGGALAFRGATGHCPALKQMGIDRSGQAAGPIEIVQSRTVNRPRDEVYAFWREIENLPQFMHHVAGVEAIDDRRSRWRARGVGPAPDLEWVAEIVDDEPGHLIAWQSVPGSDVDNSGHVRFSDAPHGGTEVHVRIAYRPPAGQVGERIAAWLDPVLGRLVREDIRRFKTLMEAGEIPTIEGQPSGH